MYYIFIIYYIKKKQKPHTAYGCESTQQLNKKLKITFIKDKIKE